MLNLRRRPPHVRATPSHTPNARADLQVRNLLDDPQLRRVMGLDASAPAPAPSVADGVVSFGRAPRRHTRRAHRTTG